MTEQWKHDALDAFTQWANSTESDLQPSSEVAQINGRWPQIVIDEGDNEHAIGIYVGWMNAWNKLQAKIAEAEARETREAELIEALRPFTHPDLCVVHSGNVEGSKSPIYGRDRATLYLGDFVRAAAVVAKYQKES